MLVSCICPTYDRVSLLEEAVESFLRQDLPSGVEAEMVVLNDCAGQEIVSVDSRVHVLNVGARAPTLGDKFNQAIMYARGELILPWEDDDISLPGRVRQAVAAYDVGFQYWNPGASWFWDGRGLHSDHRHGVCHNASAFSLRAWMAVGGYPALSGNQDAAMDYRLSGAFGRGLSVPDPRHWQYIYRWGVARNHLSGRLPHQDYYDEVGREPTVKGVFRLQPHWRLDYEEACRAHIPAS